MGLERRGNNYYFYEKKRIGNRVVSVYSGGREIGRLMHLLDRQRQDDANVEKESKKRSFEAEKQSLDEVDQVIEAFGEQVDALMCAVFLVNGYHKHSRTWRRKRNDEKDGES